MTDTMTDTNKPLHIISLGAGVQSSTMALMAAAGEIKPMPDAAVFADTHAEPATVYTHLSKLTHSLPFEVYTVSSGDLGDAMLNDDYNPVPLFKGKGMGRRQCTHQFKLRPLKRKMRELAGLAKGAKSDGVKVIDWCGISTDEIQRARASTDAWREMRYPLLEMEMSRTDCQRWLSDHGWDAPRSACVFCPFKTDGEWAAMDIADYKRAIKYDNLMRGRGEFLHSSLIPLAEVDFRTAEEAGQGSIFDCMGDCGL